MGQMSPPFPGLVYVDANAVIYRVERLEPYLAAAAPLWDALDQETTRLATSELTLLEVLVKPLRDDNKLLAQLFRDVLLNTTGFSCLPVTRTILEAAAHLRSRHGLRTPDAIHAASALAAGCTMFVTIDPDFRRVSGFEVVRLSEIAAS